MKPDMGVGYVSAAAAERQELIETHRTGIDVQAHIRRELLEFQIIQPLIDLPAEEVMEHLRFQSVNEMEFGIVEVAEAASSDEDSGSPEAPA
ncbi:MAG TPA: hypothetical protein VMV22_05520 [Acidimicrobiales bacterium]|nr:hypothetical protein [Acidimicrobiales bacterium]